MSGYDEAVGDWPLPSPSPRSLFSSMMSDDIVAPSVADLGSRDIQLLQGNEGQGISGNADQKNWPRASIGGDGASISYSSGEPKTSSRGGLLERRAGFNASKLNTESIRTPDLSKNSELRSPLLTVPPGLSPTSLLDSPVFLSNSLVQPSPTTGKLSLAFSGNNQKSTLMTDNSDKGNENTFEEVDASSFAFKPSSFAFKPVAESYPSFSAVDKVNPCGFAPLSFPSVGVSVHSDSSLLPPSIEPPKVNNGPMFHEANSYSAHAEQNNGNGYSQQMYNPIGIAEHSPLDGPQNDEGDQRSSEDANVGGGVAEDGYNWRKYGQKQVKGSEYPRSYYKCTHQNCPVKKKVERSFEGHITEIIYKGAHNHPKPPPSRRSVIGSSGAIGEMQLDSEQPGNGTNGGGLAWSNMQIGNGDWMKNNLEATSSAAMGQEYSNGAGNMQAQNGGQYESADGVDGSSTFSNDEEEEDRATHGSVSLGYDGEGDESESKRRKIESYASDISGATRAIREPRVVVQTTSEVDILDDGYRWRKYGQKVVKGNPNPRSYYKCTSAGCNVRKHVERASHDLKSVITTYEGKHNHDVPAARNSNHINSGGSNTLSSQQATAAPSHHIHRPEPSQVHGNMAQFERPSLGSFGFSGRQQLGPGPGFSYGMNQLGLAGLGMARLGSNQGKLPALPVNPFLGNPPRSMNDMTLMVSKELKLEPVTDSGTNPPSNGASSLYQQFVNRLPLGPQM